MKFPLFHSFIQIFSGTVCNPASATYSIGGFSMQFQIYFDEPNQ